MRSKAVVRCRVTGSYTAKFWPKLGGGRGGGGEGFDVGNDKSGRLDKPYVFTFDPWYDEPSDNQSVCGYRLLNILLSSTSPLS